LKHFLLCVCLAVFGVVTVTASYADDNKIKIKKALYGMAVDVDATAGVKKQCEGLTSCSFRVDPPTLEVADPRPGITESLRINWTCGNKGMKAVERHDFEQVDLECD